MTESFLFTSLHAIVTIYYAIVAEIVHTLYRGISFISITCYTFCFRSAIVISTWQHCFIEILKELLNIDNEENSSLYFLQVLVASGAAVNERENSGWSALHIASAKGHLRLVQFLLGHGGNLLHSVNLWHRLKLWINPPTDVQKGKDADSFRSTINGSGTKALRRVPSLEGKWHTAFYGPIIFSFYLYRECFDDLGLLMWREVNQLNAPSVSISCPGIQ